jgi:hypothetical protein
VPEPGFLWQVGPGLTLLAMFERRRRIGAVLVPCVLPDAASRRKLE